MAYVAKKVAEDPAFREKRRLYARNYRLRQQADPEARERRNAAIRAWRKTAKGQAMFRAAWLRKYGLAVEEFERLFARQKGRCGICRQPFTSINGPNGPHIDHVHAAGVTRGLLCKGCNAALGLFGDSPARIRAALNYLRTAAVNGQLL